MILLINAQFESNFVFQSADFMRFNFFEDFRPCLPILISC